MSRTRVIALVVVLLGCLVVMRPSRAMYSTQYAINWSVIGVGGGPMGSANYALGSTTGQTAIGPSHGATHDLCAGYWCEGAVGYRNYLPLILRDAGT